MNGRHEQPEHVQTSHPERKLGRLPEDRSKPRLHLRDFLTAGYTGAVPDAVDYSAQVKAWPVALNDKLGDCTAADACHAVQVWSTYGQGRTATPADADVLAFYEGSTGYNPDDPATDQGGVLQDVCTYFRTTGLAGHKIAAFFRVDTTNADELRTALWLFGCVSIGLAFPAFAMDQFDAGQPWDVAHRNTKIEGGHDVLLVGMTQGGNYRVVTWGKVQEVTPAFWARYMAEAYGGEAWCRVSTEWVKGNQSPEGLDVVALNAAFEELTGSPGPFSSGATPAPTPKPTPAPSPQPADADKVLATAMRAWLTAMGL